MSILPVYRQVFLDVLSEDAPGVIEVVTGDVYFSSGMVTSVSSPLLTARGHNRLLLGRRILWQSGALLPSITAPVTVIDINPRLLVPWIVIPVRRLLGRPVIGWGHAHPRSGPSSRTTPVRRLLQSLCHELLTYTAAERDDLLAVLPRATVAMAPNALYRRAQLYRLPGPGEAADVVVCGRLVEDKRPELALRAFALALPSLPSGSTLRIVGDGPLMVDCRALASGLGISDRVRFEGRVDDLVRLREVFSASAVLLSPGYVGLNVIQALGFGTPVVYPTDEPHAPEVAILDTGNSETFVARDHRSCATALVRAFQRWHASDREALAAHFAPLIGIEAMVAPFHRLVGRGTARGDGS